MPPISPISPEAPERLSESYRWLHASSLSLRSDSSKDETLLFRERLSCVWSEDEDDDYFYDAEPVDGTDHSSHRQKVHPNLPDYPGLEFVSVAPFFPQVIHTVIRTAPVGNLTSPLNSVHHIYFFSGRTYTCLSHLKLTSLCQVNRKHLYSTFILTFYSGENKPHKIDPTCRLLNGILSQFDHLPPNSSNPGPGPPPTNSTVRPAQIELFYSQRLSFTYRLGWFTLELGWVTLAPYFVTGINHSSLLRFLCSFLPKDFIELNLTLFFYFTVIYL